MNVSTTDDDFADVALPPVSGLPLSPEALEFQPWHKPRKQFVRINQWMHHIEHLIGRLGAQSFADGEVLRYLTLPGPDLLDVRMLADACGQRSIKLRYTGFCYTTDPEERRLRQNINEFSLTHKSSVLESSRVVRARFQDITVNKSEASVELERGGPYDIVNIDACEPLAGDGINVSGRLVDAIRSLTEFQLLRRRKPWLLFITTPIQADSISPDSMSALHGEVIKNTASDVHFASELSARLNDGEDVAGYLTRVSEATTDELLSVFSLGVAKWLIHLADQANFKAIKLQGYSYSMFREPPYQANMVSLCFQFEPQAIAIADDTGLTRNQPSPAITTQPISHHVRALRRAFAIQNLDEKLASESETNREMIAESKRLLKNAGYPVDHATLGYEAWLETVAQEPIAEAVAE
ncbi:PP_RS20740 family protein [Rhizobium phaseoli]|uniref:PP_RS20740 family protein n=1 Tax=Rhizobium phaseoli TaxID=396 RepID=UPI000BBAC9F5|nr:hypothetical protein [Rhizobium phaseoli]PCD67621.1 hypothetical protein CO648_11805 [Rhizobium phaseoli]